MEHSRRGELAADLHVALAQRQDGVQAAPLAVWVGRDLDGVLACGGYDAHDLLVELLLGGRVGVDEPGEGVEALVLVLEVVQQVLRLLLGVLELLREDREVVALADGAALLLDDLLVHPRLAASHEGDGLGLVLRLQEPGHVQRDGQVDDVGEGAVGELRAEPAHDEHLAPDAVVQPEAVVEAPLGLEVDGGGCDVVLGGGGRSSCRRPCGSRSRRASRGSAARRSRRGAGCRSGGGPWSPWR